MKARLVTAVALKEGIRKPFLTSRTAREVSLSAVKENWHSLSVCDGLSGVFDGKLDGCELGVVLWSVRYWKLCALCESMAISAHTSECKGERGRHRPFPPKRKSRHPAVALKKKKAMSEDRSPWWRSSSQSSASFEVKGETKPNKWGDVACHFYHLGSLVSDKKEKHGTRL